jgi:hypothetical protein
MKNKASMMRRELGALVKNGTGSWEASLDERLGKGVYKYESQEVALLLFEEGLRYARGHDSFVCKFDHLEAVNLLPLASLPKIQDPNQPVTFNVRHNSESHDITVPMVVYSSIGPLVYRLFVSA